jgi:class I fructose-bisphosphate aldolase
VDDAVRLGADAVGYTIYVGSPAQSDDFLQFSRVREEAEQAGLPLIVWSYPRGEYVDAKGGQHAFWAVDYAARVGLELGADVVKLNMPRYDADKARLYPAPYNDGKSTPTDPEGMLKQVVRSAGKTLVLLSGGTKGTEEETLEHARTAFRAGVTGLIFGRNVWQRPYGEALAITEKFQKIAKEFGR